MGMSGTLLHRREFEFEFERGDEELTDRLRSRDWLWSNKDAADLRKPNIVGRKKLCCFQRFTAKEGEKGFKDSVPNRRSRLPRFQPNANASLLPTFYSDSLRLILRAFNLLGKASNPISYISNISSVKVGLKLSPFFMNVIKKPPFMF